jgi:uncharacterized UBP type Zn finger protein
MTVELANEIWSELKRYVNTVDRDDAAETLVSVLIDNDVGPDEIKAVFKSDSDVKKALVSYLRDQDDTEDEEEVEDDDYNEDDDWEN